MKIIENEFERLTEAGDSTFWLDFNKFYVDFVVREFSALILYLTSNFQVENDQTISFIKDLEVKLSAEIKKMVLKRLAELSSMVVSVFNKQFWYSGGIPKDWKNLEESKIREDFREARESSFKLVDTFCVAVLINYPFRMTDYNRVEANQVEQVVEQTVKTQMSSTESMEVIYEAEQLAKIKARVDKEMNDIFESAMGRKVLF